MLEGVETSMKWFWSRRAEPATVAVRKLTAALDDAPRFRRLLRELPESEELAPRLAANFYARAWDAATERDLWIVSDGARVDCYVLTGLKFQQAASGAGALGMPSVVKSPSCPSKHWRTASRKSPRAVSPCRKTDRRVDPGLA